VRSLAALALVALWPGTASAKRVIMRPSISSQCRNLPSWQRVQACVRRFGKFKVVHSTSDMKLISVTLPEDNFGVAGQYLFALHANRWRLNGTVGSEYTIDNVATAHFEGHKLHRLDLSRADRREISLADGVTRPGWFTERLAMFCAPEAFCESIVLSCDVVVRGKTLHRFRGTIVFDKNGEIRVLGDRTLAGDMCAQAEHVNFPMIFD
jgi:hypothetical protein